MTRATIVPLRQCNKQRRSGLWLWQFRDEQIFASGKRATFCLKYLRAGIDEGVQSLMSDKL
jgi:hypothetical protein